jgi:hypothetical protein
VVDQTSLSLQAARQASAVLLRLRARSALEGMWRQVISVARTKSQYYTGVSISPYPALSRRTPIFGTGVRVLSAAMEWMPLRLKHGCNRMLPQDMTPLTSFYAGCDELDELQRETR